MSTAPKRVLRVVLALPAIGFLVTGLRFAIVPAGAAKGLAMPLLDGAAQSSQVGDAGFMEGHTRAVRGASAPQVRAMREVEIYDCVDSQVPVLARMLEKRLRGYSAMGYERRVAGTGATSNDEARGFEFGTVSDDVVSEDLF